jgi:hypothetical protein
MNTNLLKESTHNKQNDIKIEHISFPSVISRFISAFNCAQLHNSSLAANQDGKGFAVAALPSVNILTNLHTHTCSLMEATAREKMHK